MVASIETLSDLRGLRTAPTLDAAQRQALRAELAERMAACPWFTIGVMAPSAPLALQALRRWEEGLGWKPLSGAEAGAAPIEGSVFLKGHQANGSFWLRQEEGLGEGVLITGQNSDQPELAQTWGPLPLDLF